MYKLSPDEDMSFLDGAQLLQVCVGRNELVLNFDGEVRWSIFGDFAVLRPPNSPVRFSDPVAGAFEVCSFLHEFVARALPTSDGGLEVRFASGGALLAFDTFSSYESFIVEDGAKRVVV